MLLSRALVTCSTPSLGARATGSGESEGGSRSSRAREPSIPISRCRAQEGAPTAAPESQIPPTTAPTHTYYSAFSTKGRAAGYTAMKMHSPWARFYSNSCCLCCHVRTGTIILGIWYLILNSVVLLILLSALIDPDQYHMTSTELGGDLDFMDDANVCIATAISLLMILICAMATYGAYKQHAAWIIPFFCYQIFDFALNTLVAVSVLVYPNTIQDYLRQMPANFPYKEEILSVNPACVVAIILLFISIVLAFKAYLISCVWNCYRYINSRNASDVLVYVTTNDTTVLLPPYDDSMSGTAKDPPPPYLSA